MFFFISKKKKFVFYIYIFAPSVKIVTNESKEEPIVVK